MTAANPVSLLLSSLPLDFTPAVRQTAELGFTHVDVVALVERPAEHLDALADSGVHVACAPLGRGLPDGHTLDVPDVEVRRTTLEAMRRQLADAARLGATHAYVVPGTDMSREGMARFTEAAVLLADYAGERRVRLCVEHIPGRALPTAAGTLDWLEQVGHPNLTLLLDVSHCLITREDPAQVIARAGRHLGWVHVADNDGVSDLHWPLLTGRLTEETLRDALVALRDAGYRGALTLELNAANPDALEGVRRSKAILTRAAAAVGLRCEP